MNNTKEYSEADIISLLNYLGRKCGTQNTVQPFVGETGNRYTSEQAFNMWRSQNGQISTTPISHSELLRIAKEEAEFRYGNPGGGDSAQRIFQTKVNCFLDGVCYLADQKPGTITPKNESPDY